jgi:hypothetical protein
MALCAKDRLSIQFKGAQGLFIRRRVVGSELTFQCKADNFSVIRVGDIRARVVAVWSIVDVLWMWVMVGWSVVDVGCGRVE